MKNIVYLLGIIFSVAIGIVLLFVLQMPIGENILGFGSMLSYAWMYRRGSFRKTIWNRVFYISLSLMMIGLIAKLQHWPIAGIFILLSCLSISISYTIHFIKKPFKGLLDYFKWILVLMYLLRYYSVLSHSALIQNLQISLVYGIIHLITLILFVQKLSEQPNWLQSNGREDEDPYNLNEFLATTNEDQIESKE